jgi:hypothetical protein
MTARHQIRIGNRRLGRDRAAIDATPAPMLGEMLQLARERKGVDLFRAERDTKIRLKYLAALEDGHFEDLPAPVYVKGFLRNYAMYLALDPEEVLQRWRDEAVEVQGRRATDRPPMAAPPRPIVSSRRGITISAGWLMAVLVLAAVLGFVGYIGMQLMRFSEAPAVGLTDPPSLVSTVNAESILLAGTSRAGALITVHAPSEQLLHTTADETGRWSIEVPLAPGRNDFRLDARDPVTSRDAEPVNLIVSVPLGVASPAPSAPAAAVDELRLVVSSPREGATLEGGSLTVSGTTSGSRVTIATALLEPADEEAAAPSPDTAASPAADQDLAPTEPAYDITVPDGGRFAQLLELSPGRWQIEVTSYASGRSPVSQTRNVTIEQADEMVLTIEGARRDSWLRIVTDGTVMRGWGGPTLRRGESVTATAREEIWIRTGNAGSIRITLDGVDLGILGRNGQVGNWIFRPGMEPERTSETR